MNHGSRFVKLINNSSVKRKERKSCLPWRRIGNGILIIVRLDEVLLWIFPRIRRIIKALRSYTKLTRKSVSSDFQVGRSGNRMNSFECLIYHIKWCESVETDIPFTIQHIERLMNGLQPGSIPFNSVQHVERQKKKKQQQKKTSGQKSNVCNKVQQSLLDKCWTLLHAIPWVRIIGFTQDSRLSQMSVISK